MRIKQDVLATDGAAKYPVLCDILHLLEKKPMASTAEVGAAVNLSIYMSRYYLRLLTVRGMVAEKKCGRGVSSRWSLVSSQKSTNARG